MGELEPLRLGIFGVGRMGRVHLENLLRLALKGTVELVALGDRRESTRAAATAAVSHGMGAARTHPPAQFDDPRKMAAAVPLDGVVVASRTEDHAADSQAFTKPRHSRFGGKTPGQFGSRSGGMRQGPGPRRPATWCRWPCSGSMTNRRRPPWSGCQRV